MSALLDPPNTVEELRERAGELADDVADQLEPSEVDMTVANTDQEHEERVARRRESFETMRIAVINIASSPAWRTHDLTTELLLLVERLRDEMKADTDATDPEWREREIMQRVLVVVRAMIRQLEHNELDRPEEAARFVAEQLVDVEVGQVAALLGISTRMVATYRKGEVGQIRKDPARVTLVAQLVYELLGSMTPRGALLWFNARLPQLGNRTPLELVNDDPATHRPKLIALVRGGRAQTDQGGAGYGAVDQAA